MTRLLLYYRLLLAVLLCQHDLLSLPAFFSVYFYLGHVSLYLLWQVLGWLGITCWTVCGFAAVHPAQVLHAVCCTVVINPPGLNEPLPMSVKVQSQIGPLHG